MKSQLLGKPLALRGFVKRRYVSFNKLIVDCPPTMISDHDQSAKKVTEINQAGSAQLKNANFKFLETRITEVFFDN